jgi:epsilon-lactone hydrolase
MSAISTRSDNWSTIHATTPNDRQFMVGMRALVEPNKGKLQGIAARAPFEDIMGRVAAPEGVVFEADTIGGIAGWWCRPARAAHGTAILHLHGGWFNWGSAQAFRHLVGHIAQRSNIAAFVADYRLAPEHPFPAALDDAQACYRALLDRGIQRIALSGDSAGGNLALALLARTVAQAASGGGRAPLAAVALSPVTDLTLSGVSWETRAVADPYFTRPQAAELIRAYLDGHKASDPAASPLFGELAGSPPIRVHVGDDEMLLEDSRRYVERAVAAGVDAKLDVWMGMAHGFFGGIGQLEAAAAALNAIGQFLAERLGAAR